MSLRQRRACRWRRERASVDRRLPRRVAADRRLRPRPRLQRDAVVAPRRAPLRRSRTSATARASNASSATRRSTCATTPACRSRRTAGDLARLLDGWSASGRCRSRSWCWSATAWAAWSSRSAAHHGAASPWMPRGRDSSSISARRTAGRRWRRRPTSPPGCSACRDITRPFADGAERAQPRHQGPAFRRRCATRTGTGVDVDALLDDRTADLPLLDGANHYFIAATLTRDRAPSARHRRRRSARPPGQRLRAARHMPVSARPRPATSAP